MGCSEKNYCKKDTMSICTAKDSAQQEKCSFFEKSSYEHRCMYLIFDEYCDCLKAQMQNTTAKSISELTKDASGSM